MLYVIRITQLADKVSILIMKAAKVVRQAVVIKVTCHSTGVLSLKIKSFDQVIYKCVSVKWWNEIKGSTNS